MQKRHKGKSGTTAVLPLQSVGAGGDIARIVEGLFDVLGEHEAEPDAGMVSLLTAFIQAAGQVIDASSPEEAERNREALLSMIDRGRQQIDGWGVPASGGWTVH